MQFRGREKSKRDKLGLQESVQGQQGGSPRGALLNHRGPYESNCYLFCLISCYDYNHIRYF